MNNKILKCLGFFLLMFAITTVVMAEGGEKTKLNKPDGEPTRTHFTINNLSTWIWSNGDSDIDPGGNSGLVYPKGSGRAAVFETGFVWGGKIGGQIRVGGSAYRQGLQVGRVLDGVIAQDPDEEGARIYRVRPDWQTGDVTPEMELNADTEAEVRAQYQLDWNAWPAEWGAPYEDIDGNGSYDPSVDIPGVPGAHQTIWYVANDLNETNTIFMYGSPTMHLEMQATVWGYNVTGPLQNMLFRKYKLINKGTDDITDMYVSLWSDIDLGGAGDDYAGCDVDLSLAYCFNGTASDPIYGSTPPAVGFDYFQGPILPGEPTDRAIFDGEYVDGYYNMPMTSFYFFINSDPIFSDPTQGEYTGTLEFYNLFQGLISTTGQPFTDPITGEHTLYPLNGDPIAGTGYIDGIQHPPGDRRLGSVSGPFTMYAGDVQEIVVAEILAGDMPNVDNKSALGLLKFYDEQAQFAYDNFFQIANPPSAPEVTVKELDRKVILNWSENEEAYLKTELHDELGYKFEGYNIYQLPNKFALSKEQAVLIGQFDLENNITKIKDNAFNTKDGVVNNVVAQFGSDNGISRTIEIKQDRINNSPLYNGSEYYFAVTSYAFNNDATPKQIENPISVITVIPHGDNPGERLNHERYDVIDVEHIGTADATVDVSIVDPTITTGHDYQVYFNEQLSYLDLDSRWKYTDAQDINLAKDASPSTMDFVAAPDYANPSQFKLIGVLNADAGNNWLDGAKITLPNGVTILGAEDMHYLIPDAFGEENLNPDAVPTPIIDGQTVTWGGDFADGWGAYMGGEEFVIYCALPAQFPLTVDYRIYDDGYDGTKVDATGSVTLNLIAPSYRLESHWNVKDLTTGQDVLVDQKVVGGVELYGPAYDPVNDRDILFGYGINYAPEKDGFKIQFDGNYAAPTDFLNMVATRGDEELVNHAPYTQSNRPGTDYSILSYLSAGWSDGPTASSADCELAAGYGGLGTTSIDMLQIDVELRFTGEYELGLDADGNPIPNADGLCLIKEGTGSIATIVAARGMTGGLAVHPLNPNPGSTEPFTVRIPFEVWDVDNNKQINMLIVDRLQSNTAVPFFAFNPNDRMYTVICHNDYTENVIDYAASGDYLTWTHIFWPLGDWRTGDKVYFSYANPIQKPIDVFNFSTVAPDAFSNEVAKEDVKEINVFPNPYYGINPLETDKYIRRVTFNHLPEKAEFRIFNLAGQSVAYFTKDEPGQFMNWDLTNHHGLPVASGIYIVYIDLPDQGETKILKLAIIQEKQLLDRY